MRLLRDEDHDALLREVARPGVGADLVTMVREHVEHVRSQTRVIGHLTAVVMHHAERWRDAERRLQERTAASAVLLDMMLDADRPKAPGASNG